MDGHKLVRHGHLFGLTQKPRINSDLAAFAAAVAVIVFPVAAKTGCLKALASAPVGLGTLTLNFADIIGIKGHSPAISANECLCLLGKYNVFFRIHNSFS
jgi:hypothetical protein